MNINAKFQENEKSFDADFVEEINYSDGGYKKGYEAGYSDGLLKRQYEVWTITLIDGTTIEKEVALL